MNPVAFLVALIALIVVIFLITNVLYPFLNKDVEYFWFLKEDWFKRTKDIKKEEEKKKKREEKKQNKP